MSLFTTRDGTQIYYKDWGSGPVVSFSHGWPLSGDAWEAQMFHLASNGFRCIAHDRGGSGGRRLQLRGRAPFAGRLVIDVIVVGHVFPVLRPGARHRPGPAGLHDARRLRQLCA